LPKRKKKEKGNNKNKMKKSYLQEIVHDSICKTVQQGSRRQAVRFC
jgi:hypothetical protein